jgi:SAM-dependent methyltransferase
MLDDASQDFVIASHVLEHLADPLEILCEIHRVLRPGGTALVLLPDRRKTKDSQRPPTSLEHLIADHTRHVEAPDDAHVEEFLRCGGGGWNDAWDADERAAQFEYHRRRSFHVHCWTEGEFLLVVLHSVKHMGLDWELLDAVFVDDFPGSIEFGMVLQRALHPLPHDEAARRLEAVWTDLFERHRERQAALLAKQRLEELRAHPIFRNAAAVRRLVKKVRA